MKLSLNIEPDSENSKLNTALEAFLDQYEPSGSTEDKELLNTYDIQTCLNEVCNVDADVIYERMVSAGFSIEFIENKPYFTLYKMNMRKIFDQ